MIRAYSSTSRVALTRLIIFSLTALFLLSACSTSGSKKGREGDGSDSELSELDLAARREARFADGTIPTAEQEGIFRDVRFGFDSYEIGDAARQNIEYNVEVLRQNSSIRVQLEGHCDARGTTEYNLALGERRAKAVRDILVSYGISSSRLETISYGEEIPLMEGSFEDAWAANRRVHFSALP